MYCHPFLHHYPTYSNCCHHDLNQCNGQRIEQWNGFGVGLRRRRGVYLQLEYHPRKDDFLGNGFGCRQLHRYGNRRQRMYDYKVGDHYRAHGIE